MNDTALAGIILADENRERAAPPASPLASLKREAESTAYVVCQTPGLDTSDYSFGYVATWAGGGDQAIAGIKASGERIQNPASTIVRL